MGILRRQSNGAAGAGAPSALAARVARIQPFRIARVFERARELERLGRRIVHLELGESDLPSAPSIVAAGVAALQAGHTGYTQTLGLPVLRAALARRYPAAVDAQRVAVTTGASAALNLLAQTLIDPGDDVLLADPGYPCNEAFVWAAGGVPRRVPVDARCGFQLTRRALQAAWTARTKMVLLASPANPTGAVLPASELGAIVALASDAGAVVVLDEIYAGLVYDDHDAGADPFAATGLAADDRLFVVNSFSKYFGMTGWRLGWLVAPLWAMDAIDRTAQNLYLAPPTLAQHAALAALAPPAMAVHEQRRRMFARRRDKLLAGLASIGLPVAHRPQGAFYVYADIGAAGVPAQTFCADLLERFGVAAAPGQDFGEHRAEAHVRFSFAVADADIELGLTRLGEAWRPLAARPR